jgi:hypothetical protein
VENDLLDGAAGQPGDEDVTELVDGLHAEPGGKQRRDDEDGLMQARHEAP